MKLIASSENIEDFLERDFVYVDKTEYIYNLIRNHKRVFFSRPRRFSRIIQLARLVHHTFSKILIFTYYT